MLFTLNLMKNPCCGTAGPRGELSTFILLSKHSIKLHFQFVCLRILVYLSHLIRCITLCHGWWPMQKLTTDQCEKKISVECSATNKTFTSFSTTAPRTLEVSCKQIGYYKNQRSGGLGNMVFSGHVKDTAFTNSQQCLPVHEWYKITQCFCTN